MQEWVGILSARMANKRRTGGIQRNRTPSCASGSTLCKEWVDVPSAKMRKYKGLKERCGMPCFCYVRWRKENGRKQNKEEGISRISNRIGQNKDLRSPVEHLQDVIA